MWKILVADDEVEITELIELYFSDDEIQVIKVHDGEEALKVMGQEDINLGIIDIMMPKLNGFQVIKKIRETYKVPLIILSARDDFSDKILGLDIGADDYVTKPFNPLELKARVNAHLRRFYEFNPDGMKADEDKSIITNGDLKVDQNSFMVYKKDETVELTSTEYKIVAYLMSQPGRVFTKQQIFEKVWDNQYFDDENAIRVHISNLRDKLEVDPKRPEYLKTVRGLGYKIEKI